MAILAAIAAIAMKKFMGGRGPQEAPEPGGGGNQPSVGITGGGWQPKQASSEPAQEPAGPGRLACRR